ncbi:MAG: DUF4115 domain-containing protein [Halothiobacillaceae bacterium]
MSPSPIDSPKAIHASIAQAAMGGPGLGARLRKAREERGLTQAELGGRLNLAAATIDALEREDLPVLPGPVFVRGYLRRLAVELELDEAELQQAYTRIAGEDIHTPLRPTLRTEPMRMPQRARRFPVLLVAILLVAFVVAGLLTQRYLPNHWPESDEPTQPQHIAPKTTTPTPATPQESIPLPPQPLPPDESRSPGDKSAATPHGALPAMEPRAAEPPPLAATAATDQPQAAPAPNLPAPSQPAAAAAPAPRDPVAILELRTSTADSWVQVKDATGKVLLEEVLKPGSTRRIQGPRPLRVMIGNAAATALMLDGQAVDLTPYTRPSGTAFIASLGG